MFESNHEVKIVKYGYRVLCTQAEHLVQGGDDGVIVYEMKVEPSCQYRRLWTFEVCSSPDISSRPGVTTTTDMAVLPGVLGCSFDRLRTGSPCDVLSSTPRTQSRGLAGLPGGTAIFAISRRQLVKYPG